MNTSSASIQSAKILKKAARITYLAAYVAVFLVVSSYLITVCSSHASPHRPRGPRVAVHVSGTSGGAHGATFEKREDHQHYVPRRPIPGSQGSQEPILTHDKQLLHDKE